MPSFYDKQGLIDELTRIDHSIAETVKHMDAETFDARPDEREWPPSGYLKHLILAVKPLAKALTLPKDQLEAMFGKSDRLSLSYEVLVKRYQDVISQGFGAEDNPPVMPDGYRMPDNVTDTKAHLHGVWEETHQRLMTALESWTDAELDQYRIPHPAIGTITVREMLYFTCYHNSLHRDDIQRLAIVS